MQMFFFRSALARYHYHYVLIFFAAIKIGMMAAGKTKDAEAMSDKKIALLSPQFMSILPDEVANNTVGRGGRQLDIGERSEIEGSKI